MENYGIPNGKVRASSEWDSNHAAIQGRLHYKPPRGKQGAWSARHNNINQWLQVDLGSAFIKVTGVATQGRYNYNQWVTKYKLQYSNDGATFTYYKEPGQTADMVFSGNTDRNTVVYHFLNAPVTARYIRFQPVTWSGHISMRVELYGCSACGKALGMASYAIPNGQVKASSEWDPNHAAIQGRLHYLPPPGKQGGWSAKYNNAKQWLQIDLGALFRVTAVATQGRSNYNQWVTKYKLQYSDNGATFTYYMEAGQNVAKEFVANKDRNTVVYHSLNPPKTTHFIRFRPVAWKSHISMRVEVYGCSACGEALGMASYAIPNGQVKASSEWDPNHAAIQGRLHYLPPPGKQGGWSAKRNNANQWLQIDLGALLKVTAVATQGRSNHDQWVTKYKLQYSDDGATFTFYIEAGQSVAKEFAANKDRSTIVYHSLNPPKVTRFIRFRPVAWKSHISMRVEVYGCSACGEALGMASYAIPNGQVKASSEWDPNHAAIQGRLHYLPPPGKQGGWSAKHNNANQWLQIDLGALLKVTAVATQGRSNHDQWVTKYKLQYSDDGATFSYYMEAGQSVAKEFAANKDRSTIVYHSLNPPKVTRFIRFRPVAWKSHISMRVEVYGCSDCGEALGMASYAIPNGQVKASSEWDPNHAAIQGRLHYLPPPGKQGGWSSKHNNVNQWLQIDLGALLKVTAVATQGRSNHDQWVTKYKLQYSNDGATFSYYMEAGQSVAKEFVANKDRSSVVYHSLNPPKVTRFIRFRPVSWKSHISMRVEVYGCSARDYCEQNPCKNGATCSNVEEGYQCTCKPGYSGAQCDQDINECTNSPCQNGATCVNLQGSYRCDCKSGYNGNKCENDINECSNNPCKNGATCVNLQGSYRCDCKSGYNGNSCENDINECSNSPCKNGATCVNIQGSYRCDCKSGYNGNNCENDINECSNNPCKNGATCVNLQGSHRCDCKSGYNGNNCENDINECTNSPCKNGATCVNLQGSYRCDCKSGYDGNNCETDINECSNNPCKNGATCVNLQGSHRCDCKSGYDGNNCENDINECSNSPCKNGATCVNLVGSYRCDCKSGYDGNNCENDVNECTNNPCKNGATCVNLSGGHRCDCAKGYSGSSCETAINDCAPDPCLNGGTCVDLVDGFRCDCAAGWLGITCDDTVNFIMKKFLLFSMATLMMMDQCWSQCRTANWWGSFDKKGWSKCGSSVEYLKGFYRNNKNNNDPISLLEEGRCCKAPSPNQNQASTCKNANWWGVLDKTNRWAFCPTGYFLQGLYRSKNHNIHNIEEGHCCRPNNLPSSYLRCYEHDISSSFDNKGWSECDSDHYLTGVYRGGCDKLQCIEKIKCCMMPDSCKMANWWKAFDKKGWVQCDSTKHYITGLYRNNNWGKNDKIFLLEEAKCCPAPPPYQNTGSTCRDANWWGVLDKTNSWAVCPAGYFVRGFYRNNGAWLHHLEMGKCCKPNGFPDRYEHCYNEDVKSSFDRRGLSKCQREGYYLAGIFRGGCDYLYCIESFKCCKMNVDECRTKNPCQNGAACSDKPGTYKCTCKSGFTGKNCESDINECSKSPCKNGAKCVNLKGSYRCDCKSGYTGKNCESDKNECSANPCKNGATCVNLQGSYRCDCKSGYTGNHCESDKNECSTSPCKNGATCVNLQGSYRCDCKSGYTGKHCDSDVNECSNNPCKNGATCVNLQGGHRCDCKSGYTGSSCESDINECSNSPCKNGATCVNLQGSYRCDCKTGYTGNNCETDVNECSNNPCKNGATCVNIQGGHRCDCKSGYTGSSCESDINECSNSPCKNGATCVNLSGSYRCDCKTGYTGNNCETDIDECSNNPCQNGALCANLQGSYRCDCKTGYTGNQCQTDINECAPAPCQNGGTCVDLVGSFRCDCPAEFEGANCENAAENGIEECEM
ncbi:neurogenic locus Notch protein-like [Pocillopora damicornis]|uniref:neurogenic locus Notch protein-like n=1 Tax=Pocillopora damicornis TaxID=46731 RepID=UPI000F5529F7|nr:neurogenic locus Notch protein-like [Pocillopora damicornis]